MTLFDHPEIVPPSELRTEHCVLRPLRTSIAELDYAAYTASPDTIRIHSCGRWPMEGFTLDDEIQELRQHEERHRRNQDFAFIVLNPAETEGMGCVYVLPLQPFLRRAQVPTDVLATHQTTEAMVTFWVRQDLEHTPFPRRLVAALLPWLSQEWSLAGWVFRVIQDETSSVAALESNDLKRLNVVAPPYLACTYWLYGYEQNGSSYQAETSSPITNAIARMNLPVADWDVMEREIEDGRV